MIESDVSEWPVATLDGVTAVELLARVSPGNPIVVRRVIDAPASLLWAWLADVESSIPAFDRTVRSVTVRQREGNRLTMAVRQWRLPPVRFVCHVGAQHIVMTGPKRLYTVAYGIRAIDQGRTLFAQFEGNPSRFGRLFAGVVARHVGHDADAVKRLVDGLATRRTGE